MSAGELSAQRAAPARSALGEGVQRYLGALLTPKGIIGGGLLIVLSLAASTLR